MTAVETLRKAAEKLRTFAEDATPGPWSAECVGSEGYRIYSPRGDSGTARERRRHVPAAATYEDFETCKADAFYIAAMHPGVGFAVAHWLTLVACLLDEGFDANAETDAALVVARAVLGEDS